MPAAIPESAIRKVLTAIGASLRIVDHLPYPEQLYLEVCGLIFIEDEESTD
jgi:hypothetical protein